MEGQALCQVERDEVAVQRRAGLLQRFFVNGADSQDVVGCCEGGKAMVLGGVAEDKRATAEKVEVWGCKEGEGNGYGTGLGKGGQ